MYNILEAITELVTIVDINQLPPTISSFHF